MSSIIPDMTRRTLATGALILLALGGCSPHAAATPTKAATFTVTGSLTLGDGDFYSDADRVGQECFGLSGFDDIAQGASVLIFDNTGKQLVLGSLDDGSVIKGPDGIGTDCKFTFTVANVPGGMGPYSVEVSHRGKQPFNQNQANDVQLTLDAG